MVSAADVLSKTIIGTHFLGCFWSSSGLFQVNQELEIQKVYELGFGLG